jgi:hypothetical protein
VVEAIEKLEYAFDIVNNTGGIRGSQYIGLQIKESDTKKEAVVQAINKFLIWYNNEQRT